MQYWYNVKLELDLSKVLFVIGLLSFGLYFLAKDWHKVLTKIMIGAFGVCLVLNLHLWTEYYKTVQRQNRLAEYYELETCEKMENRFLTDLKNEKLKYFQFGIGFDLELQKTLKSKYGIESYGMGCMVQSEFDCYNELVNNYLKENTTTE
ncbi:hypothetical protein SAMN04488508_10374 [Aquimarina spongiae]|uniref:Uncharacterized protein n=2 Tax=Aquimarina spongiae TaxID=570521 RepID=A0A1M6DXB3_9FLAO|nr:hypothetical protein SAMN04488508_10374 [Aquimarina spongiae]